MKLRSSTPEFTFDDVLLLPGKTDFEVREEKAKTSLKTKISRTVTLDIPVVSAPMPGVTEAEMAIALGKKGGLGFIHHFQSFERQLEIVAEVKKHNVKVAVCVADHSQAGIEHVGKLLKLGVDLISVETGHAHTTFTAAFIKKLKKKYPKIDISVALVVTGAATTELIKAGADSIRVGIGGGSHCTTRLVTGIGRPQLSAVAECVAAANKYNIPVISDTGIKYPGDLAKAFAFGAKAVMIGGLLSGTTEAPGSVIHRNGKAYKMTWGMCTDTAMRNKQLSWVNALKPGHVLKKIKSSIKQLPSLMAQRLQAQSEKKLFEEGVEKLVPYKGSINPIVDELTNGLTRSMWYLGAHTIDEIGKKAEVVLVSSNTHLENVPRI